MPDRDIRICHEYSNEELGEIIKEREWTMPDKEKIISTLEEIKTQTAEIGLDSAVIAHKFIDKIIALLKEQERIIKQYQKADGFLFAHGWKWEGR